MSILPWYKRLEAWLEPSMPLMTAIAVLIIAITVILLIKRNPVLLAGWLTYLISP